MRALVIGDVMLDRYVWGEVTRLSPEAPVPIVRSARKTQVPGGAANVAMNIAGLGAAVTVIGTGGGDAEQETLEQLLLAANVRNSIVPVVGGTTTSKLRIIAGTQQIVRVDDEEISTQTESAFVQILQHIDEELSGASVVVLSDYAKGVLTERVCRTVISKASKLGIPVLVDPKGKKFERYMGARTICPNLKELREELELPLGTTEEVLIEARDLAKRLGVDYLTVTLSEKGIAIVTERSIYTHSAVAREVFDVSGAGDTVIATLALCVASGLPIEQAATLANIAAGIVVRKAGTAPVMAEELLAALTGKTELPRGRKIMDPSTLARHLSDWRASGDRIIFTNGCFDLLHAGHVGLLQSARKDRGRLIVAINSDRSVREIKGTSRPIVPERDRAAVLEALEAVDAVVIFDEATPLGLIQEVRPDELVKGGDYMESSVVGADEVRAWGGIVRIIPTIAEHSSTRLIHAARQFTTA
jgi:D-beta-D-heptose 7-phosphate kinase/D-beta-D-heptose 1-phosphate adenosyltransferase